MGWVTVRATAWEIPGAMICWIQDAETKNPVLKVGSGLVLTAPVSGRLHFGINDGATFKLDAKEDNNGSLHVLIERAD